MSSSLSSIILIGVVWLLIITTLFVRRQSPVRRTTKALSDTRVVYEGGSGLSLGRRRPLPAESLYRSDPDVEIELVEAEPEQVVFDDTVSAFGSTGSIGADDTADDVDADASFDGGDTVIPDVIDGDIVEYRTLDDDDTGEFPVVTGASEAVEEANDSNVDQGADADGVTNNTDVTDITDGSDGSDTAETSELSRRRFAVVDDAYIRGGDIDIAIGTDDELPLSSLGDSSVVAAGELSEASRADSDVDDLTDDDLDYAASRRGRGIYDPMASRELAEQRQRRRFQVLAGLTLATVLSLVGAVVLGGALWAVLTLGVLVTVGYLYSLRKQTVAERDLQHRRLARMRRARLGVRNTDDVELGVPDRLLRPGAVVVEIDDADPAFAELSYADVTFATYDGHNDSDIYQEGYQEYDNFDDGHPTIRVI